MSYGNPAFFALLDRGCEVLGYHGANVRDYRSPDFDISRALAENTAGIRETCRRGVAAGMRRIVFSGTIAEPHEGGGDAPSRAMSPYGLSKFLTWEVLRFHAREAGLALGKFVIANPFGRHEQERFCSYLVRCWAAGQTAEVRTPDYVRDNIPVDLLAQAMPTSPALPPKTPVPRPAGQADMWAARQSSPPALPARSARGLRSPRPMCCASRANFLNPGYGSTAIRRRRAGTRPGSGTFLPRITRPVSLAARRRSIDWTVRCNLNPTSRPPHNDPSPARRPCRS